MIFIKLNYFLLKILSAALIGLEARIIEVKPMLAVATGQISIVGLILVSEARKG